MEYLFWIKMHVKSSITWRAQDSKDIWTIIFKDYLNWISKCMLFGLLIFKLNSIYIYLWYLEIERKTLEFCYFVSLLDTYFFHIACIRSNMFKVFYFLYEKCFFAIFFKKIWRWSLLYWKKKQKKSARAEVDN